MCSMFFFNKYRIVLTATISWMLIDLGNSHLCSYDNIKNLYELLSFFREN